jgi:tetratricopeptide (TPR) repeat protein
MKPILTGIMARTFRTAFALSWKRLLAALIMLIACRGTPLADDWGDCGRWADDLDRAIRGCSNIIAAGLESHDSFARVYTFNRDLQLAEAYLNRGVAYGNRGNYDKDIADQTRAIELDPQLALAYNARGAAYAARGDLDRAVADYDQAIELKPDFGYAYYGRGLAYFAKGNQTGALNDFRRAASQIPANDKLRGQVLARIADLEKQLR